MIGIIGAMHEEIIELKKEISDLSEKTSAGMSFFEGNLHNKKVVLVESGIGKVNAAVCAAILIEKFKVSKIIFTGVAGGIATDLDVGDIVISKDLIQHDVDVTAFGALPGEIPRMENSTFRADPKLVNVAEDAAKSIGGLNVKTGRILSGDQFISSMDKIKWMRNTFAGDCVEMEGAAVAHVCTLYGVPFVVIRAISDKADHSAEIDFAQFVVSAAANAKKIVYNMIDMI